MKNNFVAFLTYVPFLILASVFLHWILVAYQIQDYPMYGNSTPVDYYAAWHQGNVSGVYYVLPAVSLVFVALWKASSSTQKVVFFIPIIILAVAAVTNFWEIFTWWKM